jgi:hypothetical protein
MGRAIAMNWRHLVVLLIVAVSCVAVITLKNMLFESSGNVDSLRARDKLVSAN